MQIRNTLHGVVEYIYIGNMMQIKLFPQPTPKSRCSSQVSTLNLEVDKCSHVSKPFSSKGYFLLKSKSLPKFNELASTSL